MQYREDHEFYADQPSGLYRPPSVVRQIIVINIVVYLVQIALSVFFQFDLADYLGLSARQAVRGYVWQFLTYAFLHSTYDVWHIVFNMLFFYMFGRELEQVLGRRRFVVFYLTAAVFAGLLFTGFEYAKVWIVASQFPENARWAGFGAPCVGASGAVMAVMMLFALYFPNRIVLLFFLIPVRVLTAVFIIVGIEALGILNLGSNIAHSAHLGGLLWGLLFARYGSGVESFLQRRLQRRRAPEPSLSDERRLDEILDKVHRKGFNSLGWSERRFLKKMSRKR